MSERFTRNLLFVTLAATLSSAALAGNGNRDLDPARFYANKAVQDLAPGAFAVQASAVPVLQAIEKIAPAQRVALVKRIQDNPELLAQVQAFPQADWSHRLAFLKTVMAIECEVNGVATPPLVVHDEAEPGKGPAFFEFDPEHPGTGTVHLWPKSLAEEPSPYAALMLTVHETRHSWQFQSAFGTAARCPDPVLVAAFAAGFRAQKALNRKLSFCDFCTMHHEHEAFQTGNYVVGALTHWTADTTGMGCWTSQFDSKGLLRIDLLSVAAAVGPEQLLTAFNLKEKSQFVEMGGQP